MHESKLATKSSEHSIYKQAFCNDSHSRCAPLAGANCANVAGSDCWRGLARLCAGQG